MGNILCSPTWGGTTFHWFFQRIFRKKSPLDISCRLDEEARWFACGTLCSYWVSSQRYPFRHRWIVDWKILLMKWLRFAGYFLRIDLVQAEERRESLPLSLLCQVLDSFIRGMNWNTPEIIIPPGMSFQYWGELDRKQTYLGADVEP